MNQYEQMAYEAMRRQAESLGREKAEWLLEKARMQREDEARRTEERERFLESEARKRDRLPLRPEGHLRDSCYVETAAERVKRLADSQDVLGVDWGSNIESKLDNDLWLMIAAARKVVGETTSKR